jgi:hypothetical protein
MYTHAFARPLIARYRTVGLAGIPLSSLLLRGLANLLIGYEFLVSIFNYRGRDIGRGTGCGRPGWPVPIAGLAF